MIHCNPFFPWKILSTHQFITRKLNYTKKTKHIQVLYLPVTADVVFQEMTMLMMPIHIAQAHTHAQLYTGSDGIGAIFKIAQTN